MDQAPPPGEARPTLLVVEDDPIQNAFYRRLLAGPDFDIVYAESLAAADDALESRSVSLVILDLFLPDGDGRTWLGKLRETEGFATLPVIVVSGTSGLQAQVDVYALGASLLVKPIDPRLLQAAVGGALDRSRKQREQRLVDEDTGLLNRAGLIAALERARQEPNTPLVLAVLELDARPETGAHRDGLRAVADLAVKSGADAAAVGRWSEHAVAALYAGHSVDQIAARIDAARTEGAPGTPAFSAGLADASGEAAPNEVAAEADRSLTTARLDGGGRTAWSGAPREAKTRTVLVAEDDDVVGALLVHRLRRDGFEVVRGKDGLEALEIAGARSFDLAIFDVLMPGMDGFELLQRVRAMPQHARTPIVMLTSLGGEQDVDRALRLGANDFVMKPFSPLELTARVHRLLRSA